MPLDFALAFVEGFSTKKVFAVIILIAIAASCLFAYDRYTQHTKLVKLDRVISIIERMHALEQADAFDDSEQLEATRDWMVAEINTLAPPPSEDLNNNIYPFVVRVLLGGGIWFLVALLAVWGNMTNKEKGPKEPGSTVVGVIVCIGIGVASGLLMHVILPSTAGILFFIISSFLLLTLVVLLIGVLISAFNSAKKTTQLDSGEDTETETGSDPV